MERMVIIRTARVTYDGADRFDVTAMTGNRVFAPSWPLLRMYLAKRRATGLTEDDWLRYVASYTGEMRVSYRTHRLAWDILLGLATATLVCYCPITPARPWCHRRVLAGILVKLGATDQGEVERPARTRAE